jgi:hypothetical protein
MVDPFHGDLEELKALVASTGIAGTWQTGTTDGHYQYRTKDGAQLNWWASTGTVTYTGKADPKTRLDTAMGRVLAAPAPESTLTTTPTPRRGQPSAPSSSSTATIGSRASSWSWRSIAWAWSPSS